ncbi:Type II secretion system protein F [Caulifigura coniformis]|uniref:Type II secretion system protein F n=1 Tax=Caulifigura coniformis TaxID=2527983 RepID=A0A517SJF7_9PLAN|nr:type II secretion system F family protein [Caulifigura coniformis]QDT56259.1 Type II secretion system protein F [Caulifigura coniformis]
MSLVADAPAAAPSPGDGPALPFSMQMFAEEASSPWTASAFRTIATRLDQGASWTEAVQSAGRQLPQFLRGVFAVAERSGSIEQVIGEYFAGTRRTRRAKRQVLVALLYPAFLLLACLVLLTGVFLFVVPPFREMFNDFGVELPWMTKLMISMSMIVTKGWPWLVVGLVFMFATLVAMLLFTKLPLAAPLVRVMQAIPIVGTASQLAGASEFCTLLGMLVKARIPLPDALRLTAGGLQDANLRQGCHRLADHVERGESPAYAASILPHFRPRLVQLLRHTEHERSFGEILRSHGELFGIQAEAQSGIAIVWMQPFLLVFVGILGGFVVICLFMPLIKLLNELS